MNTEEFYIHLNSLDREMIEELTAMMNAEMKKPEKKRDTALIVELSKAITEIYGYDIKESDKNDCINEVSKKITELAKARDHRIRRRITAVAACAVVLLGLNQASIMAYGENIFSRVYHFTKGGISLMIGENKTTEPTEVKTDLPTCTEKIIELPTSTVDPYGIKSVCAEYGISPMIPTYIPEEFQLINLNKDADSHTTDIQFTYQYNDKRIIIGYIYCKSEDGSIGIPADTAIQYELDVNSIPFTIIKEDGQYKALSLCNHLFYTFQTYGIEYDKAEEILLSLK